jgi:hypothetical protein
MHIQSHIHLSTTTTAALPPTTGSREISPQTIPFSKKSGRGKLFLLYSEPLTGTFLGMP